MTDICETCGRGIGLNPDDSLAPPVDLSRCLCPDGLECRAVAQAKAFMRFDQQDAARDLLDAIATPEGRDFARAWDNATLMYGRYGQPPALIDRWRDAVRDRESETLKCEAELDEARTEGWTDYVDALVDAVERVSETAVICATEAE